MSLKVVEVSEEQDFHTVLFIQPLRVGMSVLKVIGLLLHFTPYQIPLTANFG